MASEAGLLDLRFGQRHHCAYCGFRHDGGPWPRTCGRCGRRSYLNPLPVAIAVQPTGDGVLAVRRNQEPYRTGWALPGGFIELGETWQEALVRELREETGLLAQPTDAQLFDVVAAADGTIGVFGTLPYRPALGYLSPTREASEFAVLRNPDRLIFAAHRQVTAAFLSGSPAVAASPDGAACAQPRREV
jgi:8-oxo-dGTP pyrophosphatase MutT (NUDIX family)